MYLHTQMHTRLFIHTYMCMDRVVFVRAALCARAVNTDSHVCVYTHKIHTHVCIHTNTYICICTHIHVHTQDSSRLCCHLWQWPRELETLCTQKPRCKFPNFFTVFSYKSSPPCIPVHPKAQSELQGGEDS